MVERELGGRRERANHVLAQPRAEQVLSDRPANLECVSGRVVNDGSGAERFLKGHGKTVSTVLTAPTVRLYGDADFSIRFPHGGVLLLVAAGNSELQACGVRVSPHLLNRHLGGRARREGER